MCGRTGIKEPYMKQLYTIILLSLITIAGNSQRPGGGHKGGNRPDIKGQISGKVIDTDTKKPMEYVTVAVMRMRNQQVITGATTDKIGEFVIKDVPGGMYSVKLSFLGYETMIVDSVRINPKSMEVDLGKLNLSSTQNELGPVEIVSESAVRYEIDKKVIDVSNLNVAASETAVEILENVPSINVDIDGNVTLRGSGSFTLLIDGQPSTLDAADALKMIPASTIQDIEIITNPSAKFDSEGVSGILNIILKKNRLEGVSALINGNVGTFNNYSGDALVYINNKKTSFTIGGNYRTRDRPRFTESVRRTTIGTDESLLEYDGESNWGRGGYGTNAEFEWRPNRKSSFKIGGNYGMRNMQSSESLNILEYWNDTLLNHFYNQENSQRDFESYRVTSTYQYFIGGDKKHSIKLRGFRSQRKGEETTITEYFNQENAIQGGNKNTEDGPAEMWRFNVDYTLPFKNGNHFEAGGQMQLGESTDISGNYEYDTIAHVYNFLPQFSTNATYVRNIYALYGMYGGKHKKLGYQLGLRTEYTDREITTLNNSQYNKIDRIDPFPTVHLSYQLSKKTQYMVNYTRRIQRPRSYYLEPFTTWTDAYSVWQGNPNLDPEYINSYELGWIQRIDKGNISVEAYHRNVVNKIERIRSVYEANVVASKPENVGRDYSTGVELSINKSLTKIWKSDLSGNFYDYRVIGQLGDQNFDQQSFSWRLRWNNTLNLPKDWRVQLTASYNSSIVTAQGTMSEFYSANMAVKKDFKDGKISSTLQVRDIFSTTYNEHELISANLYTYSLREPRTPTVSLAVSVKLNNYNKRMSREEEADDF